VKASTVKGSTVKASTVKGSTAKASTVKGSTEKSLHNCYIKSYIKVPIFR